MELLKYIAEGLKKKLSDETEYLLRDHSTLRDKRGRPVIFNTVFERRQIVDWMMPVIERTIPYCHTALKQAAELGGIRLADVQEVVLAGGSTHIPAVRDRVRKEFCQLTPGEFKTFSDSRSQGEDRLPVYPAGERARCQLPVYEKVDTVVALGAAIRAGAVGGLHLTDQEGKIRVELRGLGLAEQTSASVDGYVRAPESIPLAGCKICLYVPESNYDQMVDLDGEGHFVFPEVPYDVASGSLFNFEILAADGSVLGIVGRRMSRGKNIPSNTRKPVLSRAITMDVGSGTGVERMVLVPALAALEANEIFKLSHPGGTDQVRFRLYQRSHLIKEVSVPVPSSLPRGTAINLAIKVDEFSFITIKGDIADQKFDARIEPPPPRPTPTLADATALETSFL
jgi:molecular chaperone DnaK